MARERDRAGLTELAQQRGAEVLPGQLEAAGLLDSEADKPAEPEAPPELKAGEGKYWRVIQVCHTIPADHDLGRPDHVVRAADRANALARFNFEMGILGFDGQSVRQEVAPATEADFIRAQAKRLRVDLREHRKTKDADGKDLSKKHADYGLLTWQPPGGAVGKYKVSDKGELSPVA
jgi:hypothetical protein